MTPAKHFLFKHKYTITCLLAFRKINHFFDVKNLILSIISVNPMDVFDKSIVLLIKAPLYLQLLSIQLWFTFIDRRTVLGHTQVRK